MKKSISKKRLREFGLLIGIAFPLIIGYLIPLLRGHLFRIWTLWIAIPALILGFLKPSSLFYPYKGWMALGHILGKINSYIILGIVFLAVLMPISFIMRIFGYDPLKKNLSKKFSYKEKKDNSKIDLSRIF